MPARPFVPTEDPDFMDAYSSTFYDVFVEECFKRKGKNEPFPRFVAIMGYRSAIALNLVDRWPLRRLMLWTGMSRQAARKVISEAQKMAADEVVDG